MSHTQGGLEATSETLIVACSRGSARLSRPLVYTACTLLALLTNYVLGKELLWDTLDYHLYAGFTAVHDRFAQDYFGAGPGSYFNPYAYAPFYALVSAGMPALAIASLLAVVHSAILWLTYEIALCVCPSHNRPTCVAVGLWSIALAFLNPILIEQIGSSYADITTAALALFGWLLLARALRTPQAWLPFCAGLLLGAATALKLTNAVHAVAALPLIMVMPRLGDALRFGVYFVAGLALAFVLVAGPWAYQLAQHFGNPFFPLLNNVFQSPEFTTEPLRHFRFIPGSLFEWLWRPFALADPVPMRQAEQSAPDLRYALLLLLIAWIGAHLLWRRWRQLPKATPARPESGTRVLAGLALSLAVDWILWLTASGNGRYFLPAASVAAVVLVALVFRACAQQPQLRRYLLASAVAAQTISIYMGSDYRWTPGSWSGPWFEIHVPPQLASEANLYFVLGTQSNSYVAPFLSRDSGLINVTSVYPLSQHGATGAHIERLVRRYAPHLRILVRGARLHDENDPGTPQHSAIDLTLGRFGLRVDPRDCAPISVRGLPPDLESILTVGTKRIEGPPSDTTLLLSCRAVTDDSDHSLEVAREGAVDRVFAHLEDACPQLFQPRGLVSEHTTGSSWRRRYVNTDLQAWVNGGEVKFFDLLRGDDPVYLGRESDWARAPLPLVCGRHDGHYFARVLVTDERP